MPTDFENAIRTGTFAGLPRLVNIEHEVATLTGIIRNVKDTRFAGGAKGDGTTDDTTAIAMAAAAAAGGVLYFPPGTYKVDLSGATGITVPNNTIVMGAGRGSKIAVSPTSFAASVALFTVGTTDSAEFRDIWVDGPASYSVAATGSLRAIQKQGTTGRVRLDNVYVTNCSYALKVDSQADVYVTDCEFVGPGAATLSAAATGILHGGQGGRLHVTNTKLDSWGKTGSNQHHGVYVDRAPGFIWVGGSIDNIFGTGFAMQIFGTTTGPQYDHVIGCNFGSGCVQGIITNSLGLTKIIGCNFAAASAAITLYGDTLVEDCTFAGSGGTLNQIAPGQAGTSNKLDLRNSVFSGTNQEDVRLDTTGWTYRIADCRFHGAVTDHVRVTTAGTDAVVEVRDSWFSGATATAVKFENGSIGTVTGCRFTMSGGSARAIRNLTNAIGRLHVLSNEFAQASQSLLLSVTPTVWEADGNFGSTGFKTRAGGTASVTNGSTISHTLGDSTNAPITPTRYGVIGTVAKRIAAVTATSTTTLTVALHDDTGAAIAVGENVAWWAEK